MRRIITGLCLLLATGYARGQSFANYAALNGTSQFGTFNTSVLNGASVFTIEFWIKTTESGSSGTYWQRPTMVGIGTAGNSSNDFGITSNNGYIGFWHGFSSSGDLDYLSTTQQINNNAWHHIALVNDGTNARLYLDGSLVTSLASGNGIVSTNAPVTVGASSLDFGLGGNNTVNANFFHQGQYAEMRLSNSVRYIAAFTPATSFTPDANTVSLLHFAGICGVKAADASANSNDLTLNAGAPSCAALPFGSDFSFDGNQKYGLTPAGMMNGLSTFTIEGWIKTTDLGVTPNGELWRAPNIIGNASNGVGSGDLMVTTQAGYLTLYTGLNTNTGDNAVLSRAFIADNQWHHWAVSANGTTALLFADGIKVGTLAINRSLATSGNDAFGVMTNNSSCCGGFVYKHSGELDEVRFSNSARYTGNFTPPSGTFTSDAATVALYHMNSYNCLSLYTPDASANNDSLLLYGYASCQPDPAYPASIAAAGNITKGEYFIDADPGFGGGINIPLTAAQDISNLSAIINTTGLIAGVHRVYLRTQNAAGVWGHTNERDFLVDYNPPYGIVPAAPGNITGAEYFIDADPGFGSGTAIAVTPALNISGQSIAINTAALGAGVHRVYLRTRNAAGAWSLTNVRDFLVDYDPAYPGATATAGPINKLEYFVDTDPGFGNGTDVAVTPAVDISNISAAIATASLGAGVHRVYLRSRSAAGRWSLTNVRDFLVDIDPAYPAAPPAPGNITRLEYFLDTDPGFGNGTAVAITPAVNIGNNSFGVNTGTLAPGNHVLYLRSYDDWSLTSATSFMVSTSLPVHWLAFTGMKRGNTSVLNWQVSDERGVNRYVVERSGDGALFSSIGTVQAKGSAAVNEYAFTDERPLAGINFYRIRQEEASGQYSYSTTVRLNFASAALSVNIYPNPASDVLTISPDKAVEAALRLYSSDGKVIWSGQMNGTTVSIPVASLADGLYQLSLITNDGETMVRSIAVRH